MQARPLSVVLWSLGQIGFCPSDASVTAITDALAAKLPGTEEQVGLLPIKLIRRFWSFEQRCLLEHQSTHALAFCATTAPRTSLLRWIHKGAMHPPDTSAAYD